MHSVRNTHLLGFGEVLKLITNDEILVNVHQVYIKNWDDDKLFIANDKVKPVEDQE